MELLRETEGEGIKDEGESSFEMELLREGLFVRFFDSKLESDIFLLDFGAFSDNVVAGSEFLLVCLSALKKSWAKFFILSLT